MSRELHPYRPLPLIPTVLPKRPWYLRVFPSLFGYIPAYRRAYGGFWALHHADLPRTTVWWEPLAMAEMLHVQSDGIEGYTNLVRATEAHPVRYQD